MHPPQALVLDMQEALWQRGLMRAARNANVLIAAYAVANDLTLVTCDRDFGLIAGALHTADFRQEFVAE